MMLEPIADLPEGVIGFESRGQLQADDYRDVLLPAVGRQVASGGGIRVVMVFEEWDGVDAGAAWEDLKLGVEHFGAWERFALVTDLEWMTRLTHLFGWMSPGEVKHFPLDQRQAAAVWAAGTD